MHVYISIGNCKKYHVKRKVTIVLITYHSPGFICSFIWWRSPCSPLEVYDSEQVPGTQVSMFVCCLDKYVVVLPAFELLFFTLMPRNFVLEIMGRVSFMHSVLEEIWRSCNGTSKLNLDRFFKISLFIQIAFHWPSLFETVKH